MYHFKPGSGAAGWLAAHAPDDPVAFFSPDVLDATHARFRTGFPGLVTYAVKANPDPDILTRLAAGGMTAFDVASVPEMELVRRHVPGAVLHYHNPVRSRTEIAAARALGVASWSVDRRDELDKLGPLDGAEIAVRLKLPVPGGAYDFGSKFGAEPDAAATLMGLAAARGARVSLTFHPGTQCDRPDAWARYIHAAGDICRRAGIRLCRLNVGGGFAAHRGGAAPAPEPAFRAIARAAAEAFGDAPPLVCEPGRALVAEAVQIALRIKALDGDRVYLNDGLYGCLAEWRDIAASSRLRAIGPDGQDRRGRPRPRTVFGPTCDSLDRLPAPLPLPEDLAEGDHLLIAGMGAYAETLATGFNGYGRLTRVTLPAGPALAGSGSGHLRAAV